MTYPTHVSGARICILRYPDEICVCANIAGFAELGDWIAWLATSDPAEKFHLHILWHLESEASRFDGVRPRNVWFLSQSKIPELPQAAPPGPQARDFELTFQVLDEVALDELAKHQDSGLIPEHLQKREAAIEFGCD